MCYGRCGMAVVAWRGGVGAVVAWWVQVRHEVCRCGTGRGGGAGVA